MRARWVAGGAAVVAAVIAATPARARAGACAPAGLAAQALTHAADAVPADGGVLVGTQQVYGGPVARDEDPTIHGDYRFVVGKRSVKVTPTPLAPGLSVAEPPDDVVSAPGDAPVQLVTGKDTVVLSFHTAEARPFAVPAPQVRRVVTSRYTDDRSSSVHATAALVGPAPADAVAVILYDARTNPPRPLSWQRVTQGALQASLYASGGRCQAVAPGTEPPHGGQPVAIAWVDGFGRRSPLSAPVEVEDVGEGPFSLEPPPPPALDAGAPAAATDAGRAPAAPPAKAAEGKGCGCDGGAGGAPAGLALAVAAAILIPRHRRISGTLPLDARRDVRPVPRH